MRKPQKKTKPPQRKRKPPHKEGDVVLVKWSDAQSRTCWSYTTDAGNLATITSTGFFLGRKKSDKGEYIQVALSKADDGMVSDIISIPIGCVVSVTLLLEKLDGIK